MAIGYIGSGVCAAMSCMHIFNDRCSRAHTHTFAYIWLNICRCVAMFSGPLLSIRTVLRERSAHSTHVIYHRIGARHPSCVHISGAPHPSHLLDNRKFHPCHIAWTRGVASM